MPPEPEQRDEAAPGPVLSGAGTPVGSQRTSGSLTKGYEAVHDLRQVLAAVLLLGGGLGAHLGQGHAGRVQLQEHHGLAPSRM